MTQPTLIAAAALAESATAAGVTEAQLNAHFGGQATAWLSGEKPVPAKYAHNLNRILGLTLDVETAASAPIDKETTTKRRPRRRRA